MTKTIRPSIFLRAAKVLPKYEFACHALEYGAKARPEEIAFFEAVLKPRTGPLRLLPSWYGDRDDGADRRPIKERNQRTIGLLLCELLAKEGFEPDSPPPSL